MTKKDWTILWSVAGVVLVALIVLFFISGPSFPKPWSCKAEPAVAIA